MNIIELVHMEVDLNLLRVFDVLYEECNVTRAAARLFLTQSAVSHALARLRDVLADPLFLRVPTGLQPTLRAHPLSSRLPLALAEIRSVVAVPVFDPATTSRRFTISASSYFSSLTARLIALARKSAPGISLQIVNTGAKLTQALDQQDPHTPLPPPPPTPPPPPPPTPLPPHPPRPTTARHP